MEIEEAKKEVSEILRKVIHAEEVYYLDGKYVRWGRVEKDLHAVLERLLTQRALDGARVCPECDGAVEFCAMGHYVPAAPRQ